MTTLWSNTGNQKETESLKEKRTLPKAMFTIEIMHKRQSNYTVYFFSFKMLDLQLTIRVALCWHFQGQTHHCKSDNLYNKAWLQCMESTT